MLRLALAHVRRAPLRTLAVVFGIVLATASFVLLTAATQRGRLEVRGQIDRNYRSQYDILVRPRNSRSGLERIDQLVRPGALSGINGGITMGQWRSVRKVPGVAVAAPLAVVGYALPSFEIPLDLTEVLGDRRDAVVRIDLDRETDRGLTKRRDQPLYAYLTRRPMLPEPSTARTSAEQAPRLPGPGGSERPVCVNGYRDFVPSGPFDPAHSGGGRGSLICASLRDGLWGEDPKPFPPGRVGALIPSELPVVIAAVDPEQEARLTGLNRAVVAGRSLRASDRPSNTFLPEVPVVAATSPGVDQTVTATVQRLPAAATRSFLKARSPSQTASALRQPPGQAVLRKTITAAGAWRSALRALEGKARFTPSVSTYWAVGSTPLRGARDDRRPVPVRNVAEAWRSDAEGGYVAAPLSADDVAFRTLTPSVGATQAQAGAVFASLSLIGRFDPTRLSKAADTALDAYFTPGLEAADADSRRLLKNQPLLPNGNIAGYQTQSPVLITNLGSLSAFGGANYDANMGRAPISAIRVKVAGAVGLDAKSRERVRQVADALGARTGLDIDLTIGSSPSPQRLTLPSGAHGRPELHITERWTRKGVAVALVVAIDRKSALLFGLVLVVCALFVANASSAALAARRTEFAILSSTGWSAPRILTLALIETLLTGLIAGLLGGGLALGLAPLVGADDAALRAAVAIPAAAAVSVLAGVLPAIRAARAHPARGLQPPVARVRTARRARSIKGMAVSGVLRTPARTGLAILSVTVGVAALTVLLSITIAFRDAAVGSVLGQAVTLEARTVDYIAAATMLLLAAGAVADVLYLNLLERRSELAVLRALGWTERHIQRLILSEGALIGLAGGVLGALTGVVLAALLTSTLLLAELPIAGLAVLVSTVLAALAVAIPARIASRAPLGQAIAAE